MRLQLCTGSPESWLFAYTLTTNIMGNMDIRYNRFKVFLQFLFLREILEKFARILAVNFS